MTPLANNEPSVPVLAIVTGTYNRLDQIKQCVASVLKETSVPFKLYVTDAGSTDGTIEYLESVASERVVPIFEGQRFGQAKAYNDVFAQVDAQYCCWISDDNVIVDGGLDKAVAAIQGVPSLGMLGLKVRDMQGPFTKAPYIGGISEAGILNVNQGLLPIQVLREVGGFSEVFRNYGIDPDLTAKVLLSGYDVAYTKAVVIHHNRNWSEDSDSPEYRELQRLQERAKVLYRAKYACLCNPGLMAKIKLGVYAVAQKYGQLPSINSHDLVWGSLARDWFNIAHGRYISPWDAVVQRTKGYHLLQRYPKYKLPGALPADPDPNKLQFESKAT